MCSRNCNISFSFRRNYHIFLYHKNNYKYFENYSIIREFINHNLQKIKNEDLVKMLLILLFFFVVIKKKKKSDVIINIY